MAAPELYERAAMSMDAIPVVRLIFGVLIAIWLYLTYVGWLTKPASPLAKILIAGSTQDERAFDLDRRTNQSLCSERTLAAVRAGLCLEILQTVRPRVATHRRDCAHTHDSDDRGDGVGHRRNSERSQSDAQRSA